MCTLTASFLLILGTVSFATALAPQPVPEPATMALVGGGLAAAILIARRRNNKKK
jgi:hypothetical protein